MRSHRSSGSSSPRRALRWLGRRGSPSSADLYLQAFHDPARGLRIRELPGRILAAIATLGSGGAMGMEGPSLYLGASIGTAAQKRFLRFTATSERTTLLVAGAAAGVSAIFKAPATGAVFALEVPYDDDIARRMLLPALVGSTPPTDELTDSDLPQSRAARS